MKIKNAMILAAGLGKRMQPLTLKTPKALLKVGGKNLLERAINLLINNGVENITINIHHLGEQIKNFLEKKNYRINVSISDETSNLLDTGGGILKGTSLLNENDPFFVINPDTLWTDKHSLDIKNLINLYLRERKPCMLVVDKEFSFDRSFKGDFTLSGNTIEIKKDNQCIYTGLQILKRSIFLNETDKVFSMNKIWKQLIKKKNLLGLQSKQKFYHLNTFEVYQNISDLKFID